VCVCAYLQLTATHGRFILEVALLVGGDGSVEVLELHIGVAPAKESLGEQLEAGWCVCVCVYVCLYVSTCVSGALLV
jgi:hypothetical protein